MDPKASSGLQAVRARKFIRSHPCCGHNQHFLSRERVKELLARADAIMCCQRGDELIHGSPPHAVGNVFPSLQRASTYLAHQPSQHKQSAIADH